MNLAIESELCNEEDDNVYFSLSVAIQYRCIKSVRALIKSGENIEALDMFNDTPLYKAVIKDYAEIAEFLIRSGANVKTTRDGETLLHTAVKNGSIEVLRALLKLDETLDINAQDSCGVTPLHTTASMGRCDMMQMLIDSKKALNINAKNWQGDTALHKAASYGQTDIIQILVDAGADINAQNQIGNTPLHLAVCYCLSITQAIIRAGANPDIQNNEGNAPLHTMVSLYYEYVRAGLPRMDLQIIEEMNGIMHFLIDSNANVNAQNDHGITPLHEVVAYMNAPCEHLSSLISTLINLKADPNIEDSNRKTPLSDAASRGQLDVVEHLLNFPRVESLNLYSNAKFLEAVNQKKVDIACQYAEGVEDDKIIEKVDEQITKGDYMYASYSYRP